MPRPPTWLARLHEIRRTVANSVRTVYERKDLERLFELQARSAQNLLALLPTVPIGKAHVVEREALVSFLDQVHQADDPIALCGHLRRERAVPTRSKLRFQITKEFEPGDFSSLPPNLKLSRGHLELSFQTLEELGESLFAVARLLLGDPGELGKALEPEPQTRITTQEIGEMELVYAELEGMERIESESRRG